MLREARRGVTLVGPLPPPVGGVASHVAGLAHLLSQNGVRCTIIDGYPTDGPKDTVPGTTHIVVTGYLRFLKIWWLLFCRPGMDQAIIHFHFSTVIGRILFFPFFLPKRNRFFFATIHHGNQAQVYARAPWPLRRLARSTLHRMDMIIALSEAQRLFYQSLGIAPEKLTTWVTPAIAPVRADPTLLPVELKGLLPIELGGEASVLVASGYPHDHYGFEDCVRLLDDLTPLFPCQLIICLYGSSQSQDYEAQLRAKLSRHPGVHIIDPLPAAGFSALLAKASLYLRPSTIDSYGFAVTEALDQGVPCVASDVCGRDPRSTTYPSGDYEAFKRHCVAILTDGRQKRARQKFGALDLAGLADIMATYRPYLFKP